MSKAAAFVAELRRGTGNDEIEARYLDLRKLSSVADFASSFASEEDGISALLNNAASVDDGCTVSEDGFEMVTQVNYLAPVLLTTLLLPTLELSGAGRAVHVSCPAANTAKFNVSDLSLLELAPPLTTAPNCHEFARYSSAKLMLIAFSAQLSKRRTGGRMAVTTNVFDPIAIDTPSASSFAEPPAQGRRRGFGFGPQVIIRKVLGFILSPILGPLWRKLSTMTMRTADDGGRGLVHVATSTALTRASGKLYSLGTGVGLTKGAGCKTAPDECGQAKPPAATPDGVQASTLWDQTYSALHTWLPEGGAHCDLPGLLCGRKAAAQTTPAVSSSSTKRSSSLAAATAAAAALESAGGGFEEDMDFD